MEFDKNIELKSADVDGTPLSQEQMDAMLEKIRKDPAMQQMLRSHIMNNALGVVQDTLAWTLGVPQERRGTCVVEDDQETTKAFLTSPERKINENQFFRVGMELKFFGHRGFFMYMDGCAFGSLILHFAYRSPEGKVSELTKPYQIMEAVKPEEMHPDMKMKAADEFFVVPHSWYWEAAKKIQSITTEEE